LGPPLSFALTVGGVSDADYAPHRKRLCGQQTPIAVGDRSHRISEQCRYDALMVITPAKWASLALSAGHVAFAVFAGGPAAAIGAVFSLLLPLALIWFSEELSSFTGGVGGGRSIDAESPEWLVAGIGWVLLVSLPIVAIWKHYA
jgi:hypothetical protein